MRKLLAVLAAMMVFISGLSAADRPVFALVLSGGGAKGVAHVPILQELDRRGIVPDMVLGTSMGALIGGFYAAGYTGDDLETIINENDFMGMIFQLYAVREATTVSNPFLGYDTNLLTVEFGTDGIGAASGLLDDQYVNAFMRRYLSKVLSVTDFDDLPIPYRCIGADVTNSRRIVFDSGSLFDAMRASMAIPIVFAPVQLADGSYVMDGGLEDNLPIDLARSMGADIVLAVDVGDVMGLYAAENKADTLSGAFTEFTDYLTRPNTIRQYGNADWVIVPDLTAYSTMDFGKLQGIMEKGQEAVDARIGVFDELETMLAPYKEEMAAERILYRDIEAPLIEGIVHDVASAYDDDFEAFIGRPMDYRTITEFERLLSEIREHERLKSVTYDIEAGIITVSSEPYPPLSGDISLGLNGGIGVRYDGTSTYFVYNPEFTLSGRMALIPSLYLTYGITIDEGITLDAGLSYPFFDTAFLYGDIGIKYGQLSYMSIPGTKNYNFGNDAGVFAKFGIGYLYRNDLRLDFIIGADYSYIAGMSSGGQEILKQSHNVYPYGGIGFVYDGYRGERASDDGFEGKLVFTAGCDIPDMVPAYSFVLDFFGSFGPTPSFKFIFEGEASTVRRARNLAAAYRVMHTGPITYDYAYIMGGIRLPLPASAFIDAGVYAEGYDKDASDLGIQPWRMDELVPFATMDDIDIGGYIAGGIITSFGKIAAEVYISGEPRFSFMVTIE